MKSYRPKCLLPIFAKAFERLLFNSLSSHLDNNSLFTKCQSGFNLKSYGVEGNSFRVLENYNENQKQRVIHDGVILFVIYINNSPTSLISICKTFADDTSIFSKVIDHGRNIEKDWQLVFYFFSYYYFYLLSLLLLFSCLIIC